MYTCYQDNIVHGNESFNMSSIIIENLLYVAIWVLAGYLLWPIWVLYGVPMLSIIWAVIVVVIQILLKKHNCSGCYYYDKLCHLGWGKLTSVMFEQDSGDPRIGMKLSIFYIVSPPLIFLSSLVFAIAKNPAWVYWIILVLFILLNVLTFPIRKKGCRLCVMREVCPGSAAKGRRPA